MALETRIHYQNHMSFCGSCGAAIDKGWRYCISCDGQADASAAQPGAIAGVELGTSKASTVTQSSSSLTAVLGVIGALVSLGLAMGASMRWTENGFGMVGAGTDWPQGHAIVLMGLVGAAASIARVLGLRSPLTSLTQAGAGVVAIGCAMYIANQIGAQCIDNTFGACVGEGGAIAMVAAVGLTLIGTVELLRDFARG